MGARPPTAEKHYQDCLIVSLTAIKAQDRAFSADTDLAEILLVATRKNHLYDPPGAIRYANLHQRPANPLEAYAVARALSGLPWKSGPQPFAFADTATEIGIHMQTATLQGGCVALRHAELAACLLALTDTPAPVLRFPRLPQAYPLALAPLARLGDTVWWTGTSTARTGAGRLTFIPSVSNGFPPIPPSGPMTSIGSGIWKYSRIGTLGSGQARPTLPRPSGPRLPRVCISPAISP